MHIEFLQATQAILVPTLEKETKVPNPRLLCEQEPKRNLPLAQTRKSYSSMLSKIHA